MTKRSQHSQHRPSNKKLKFSQSSRMKNTSQHNSAARANPTSVNPGLANTLHDVSSTARPSLGVEYLEEPIKSENDTKEYKVIKLPNGLTALLISDMHSKKENCNTTDDVDPISSASDDSTDNDTEDEADSDGDDEEDDEGDSEDEEDEDSDCGECDLDDEESAGTRKKLKREEKMAACGLSVSVGSFSDPQEIPGLAHFLEHMVFMGSEKYPKENDFDVFIKKRGGSDNASTDCETTTFYFDIQEKHLLPALDRFAQFFIHPLMKRDAITRERESVESEFQMALPSDYYRREQLMCSFAKSDHPATKFAWGNLSTLRDNVSDDVLYRSLHEFRERHYSAHRMKLAIQARLPLEVLEDYVVECFSNVPANNLPPDDFTSFKGADSFETERFQRLYKIKPVKDVCEVNLTWSMPPMLHKYRSKPEQYVSWILGHEGRGSLISYLKKKMWCLDIYTSVADAGSTFNSMFCLLGMSLVMTDEGHKNLEEILNAVFSYINLLIKEGPQEHIFNEIRQIEETNFRFADEVPPAEYVEDLAENMHVYPPKDYITGSELYFEYDPEAIKSCLEFLTPENVNIMITDKLFKDEEFNKVEPWFQTKFTDLEIPTAWLERWKTIEPFSDFHLPLPNIYLTDDFKLIPLPENVPKYPTKIHSDEICEIFYRPDSKFRLPECYMCFYFISPFSTASAKSAAMLDLYVSVLNQLRVEELYPATVAGLNHQIDTGEKGVILKLSGFNQKLPMLLITVVKYIAESSSLITEDLFTVMKREQIKTYYNTFLKPKKLSKDVRLSILMQTHWTIMERHSAISTVQFDEFLNFVQQFTKHIYIQSLVQGNMIEKDVIEIIQKALNILNCGPLKPGTAPQSRIAQLPTGSTYCKVHNYNENDVNSAVMNYYQADMSSSRLSVIIELIIMIMEEPLFDQLRTKEQLGYNVFCLMRDTYGILGYSITVHTQADKHSTEDVDARIEHFLKMFKDILKDTSVEDLASVIEAWIKSKQCADVHLKEEVSRNWMEIATAEYLFDRIERELSVVDQITIEDLRNWMSMHTIGGSNLRKLSVQVLGNAKGSTDEESRSNENKEDDKFEKSSNSTVDYPLRYCSTRNSSDDENAVYVNDIEKYKQNLYIFPVYKPTAL